jgi:preprotein translocase subunit SecE
VADRDKVDPADEPDTAATPGEPEGRALDVDDVHADESEDDSSASGKVEVAGRSARAKKDRATPKQKRDAAEHHRTGPVTFVQQSVAELRKVVYPTGPQLANYFVVVLIFVLFIIAYVSLLDLGIGAAIFRIFA